MAVSCSEAPVYRGFFIKYFSLTPDRRRPFCDPVFGKEEVRKEKRGANLVFIS
jgi:hypothetical protein